MTSNKLSLLCFVLLCYVGTIAAQTTRVSFSLRGKAYPDLSMRVFYGTQSSVRLSGRLIDKETWAFEFPDSLFDTQYRITLEAPDSIIRELYFRLSDDGKYLGEVTFSKDSPTIIADYIGSSPIQKLPFYHNKDRIFDDWQIRNPSREMHACMELFTLGYKIKHNQEELDHYLSMMKKYADTHSCVAQFYNKLNFFPDKKEIEQAYNLLSEKQKGSYYGRKIHRYLYLKTFPSIQLPVEPDGTSQPLALNNDYTLVVFGASWCKPCRDEIPILRRMDENLKGYSFRILLISIDEQKDVANWLKLMEEQQIPWLYYLSYKQVEQVMDVFTIKSIPTSYLIFKDGTFEKVDIRKQEEYLYNLIIK